jgi:hypothetical protein
MIRKFNYTGRKKIKEADIKITLIGKDRSRRFDAILELGGYYLPSGAAVYLEPYYHFSFMRFKCGTVGALTLPADTTLTEIPASDIIYFRVKVVDESGRHGRLLAVAEGIKPVNVEEGKTKRKSLLPVQFSTDLDQQVWKISFDEHGPVLHVNRQIQNRRDLIKSDEFMSLAYPAVVREVITRIVTENPSTNDTDDFDSWVSLWLKFTRQTLHVSEKPVADEVNEDMQEWVENVVEAFSRKYTIRDLYDKSKLAK